MATRIMNTSKNRLRHKEEKRVQGKTKSGFEFEMDETVLDDMRILDMIVGMSSGDVTQLSPLTRKILGDDQKERLYRHLEEKEGRASISRVSEEITEIFEACKSGKNSSSSPE